MISDPEYLTEVCTQILNIASDALDDPPARAYVAHGLPAWDCEQLAVFIERISAVDQNTCSLVHKLDIAVEIARSCQPVPDASGNPPAVAALDAATAALAVDGWSIWRGLIAAWMAGTLADGVNSSRIRFTQAIPLPPAGTFAGWRIQFSIEPTALPASGS